MRDAQGEGASAPQRAQARPHQHRVLIENDPARAERVWWRPADRDWWLAVLFAVGSACFIAGALAAQWGSASRPGIGVTFFVGSIFFTSAAFLQCSEAAATRHRLRADWVAALVQLAGTVLFNISTFTAMNHNLTTHQTNARAWAPDAFGSVAFLISSGVSFGAVCHGWICVRLSSESWRIAAINLLGSVAFGVSAVASLIEPASGQPVSARIANAGTSFGGLCFLIGALLLIPQSAEIS